MSEVNLLPFNDLEAVLEQETEKYRRLLQLLGRQRDLIIKGNLHALTELVKHAETLVLELKVMEEARLALLSRVSAHFSIPLGELTLLRLIDLVPDSQAERFRALLTRLGFLVTRLSEESESNRALLGRSTAYVQDSLSLLTQVVTPSPIYLDDGRLMAQPRSLQILNSQV